MSQADLLTDEDIQTRHEPPKDWFNQFITLNNNWILCSTCQRMLSEKQGTMIFSCCPATFPTYEAAFADVEEKCSHTGERIVSYIGTFEL